MNDLLREFVNLSPEQRQLLLKKRQQQKARQADDKPDRHTITPVTRQESHPLSFAQQRMWFLHQLEPHSAAYNVYQAIQLSGTLNLSALTQSLNALVQRHEILRTAFVAVGGQPVQKIGSSHQVLPLPLIDLSALPVSAHQRQVRKLTRQLTHQPFDLAQAPLLRPFVMRLHNHDHILLLTMHHIISDGWSVNILLQEMATLYEAYKTGQPATLKPLAVQYVDYAHWQRGWLEKGPGQTQLAYWQQQLTSPLPLLEVPTDHPRPAVQTFSGDSYAFLLPLALSKKLNRLCQQESVTLFMLLLAAFKTLLFRYTGQEDLIVGTAIANRNQPEMEGVVGCFVNTLALRTRPQAQMRFRDFLAQVRQTASAAYAHQDIPFDRVIETIQPERDLSRSPLFQVMFLLQNTTAQTFNLPDLAIQTVSETESQTAKFDLSVHLWPSPTGITGRLRYNTDLFHRETIVRMVGHFQTLLIHIVANPNQKLAALDILTPPERQQLLTSQKDIAPSPPQNAIHELFEAQAVQTPQAVAVVYKGQELTYEELNKRANQLAHYLHGAGVGPETLVGLCVERSLSMVIAIMGILKAGGAYVALDPLSPQERLSWILEDAQISLLVTQEQLVKHLPAQQAKLICLDSDWQTIAQMPGENLALQLTADNLAYVIYTSGSTGNPKGSLVTHRNVTRLFKATQPWYRFDERDVWTLFHSYAFDFSVWEIWGALLYGGKLVVVPHAITRAPDLFYQLLCQEQITVLNQTPSAFRQLVWADNSQAKDIYPKALRYIIFGGEALDLSGLKPWFARYGDAHPQLVNMYGITETTVHVTYRPLRASDANETSGSYIGSTIPDLQVYILDQQLSPLPIGIPGQLYVSGEGLSRGYLNRPALTADRFIPHPFSDQPGTRLYKTGDLARYLRNGDIEYLGRIDQQVKVRGFRIEPGEIEQALSQHPVIKMAVVSIWEKDGNDRHLIAYIVPHRDGTETDIHYELRQFLKKKLPDYMVPSYFICLESFPLTTNGKLDRRALPIPNLASEVISSNDEEVLAPTPTEEMLAGIWTDILGLEYIGRHDDFFEQGGHSLLATRLISRVCDVFQVDMSVRTLFDASTISELAKQIEDQHQTKQGVQRTAIQPISRDKDLPLSFAQQRLWFLYQLDPTSTTHNLPLAVRLTGSLSTKALTQSLNEIVRRHEILRTTYTLKDGQSVQIIAPATYFSIPIVDLQTVPTRYQEKEIARQIKMETQQHFDLTKGPLFRARLLRLSAEEHIALLTVHRIIDDGWSKQIMLNELATLYTSFAAEFPSPLPELAIQYADYAHWQREQLQGEQLKRLTAYWKQKLANNVPMMRGLTDYSHPPTRTQRGNVYPLKIASELSAALKRLSRQEEATLFMTLLSVYNVLLFLRTKQTDISIGMPVAGRTKRGTEKLVGFFANTLVLRTRFEPDITFRQLLKQVRQESLEAYAHQELPFDKLVEEMHPRRDIRHTPLFQVWLAFQNYPSNSITLPDLTITPLPINSWSAMFDLSLILEETSTGIGGIIEYDLNLFEPTTIAQFARQFIRISNQVVGNPDTSLVEIQEIVRSYEEQYKAEKTKTYKKHIHRKLKRIRRSSNT